MLKLKSWREAMGWSQTELARRSGVSQSHISDIERNAVIPSVVVAKHLADACSCSINRLFREPSRETVDGIPVPDWVCTIGQCSGTNALDVLNEMRNRARSEAKNPHDH